ncbi:hypothetical protein ACFTUC_38875 [Streptomyces sp. NPDC056944]|uniref:hypothetical protein n=1 Tax=unclassified Streptomyces TaxID=2593676 RepID=UPI00363B8C15
MPNQTNQNPERLSLRWTVILLGGLVAGAVFFALVGPVAALAAAGATVLGLQQIVA